MKRPLILDSQNHATGQALPTLIRVTAYTDRGTFYRRSSGRWDSQQRDEEWGRVRGEFGADLYASGCRRIRLRTQVFVELPLFGWCEVEA